MEVKNLISKTKEEIIQELTNLGFSEPSHVIASDLIVKRMSESKTELGIHILLRVYHEMFLESKEKEFNKHIENARFFLFEK
jgi:hypothetical protein